MSEQSPAGRDLLAWRWYGAGALLAALVLLFGYRAHLDYRRMLVESFQGQQSLLLLSLQSAVLDHYAEEEQDLNQAVREIIAGSGGRADPETVLGNLYASHSQDFSSLAVFDGEGKLSFAAPSAGLWGPALREAVRAAAAVNLASGRTFVTEAFVSPAGDTGLALCVPYAMPPGGATHLLVGSLRIEDFMLRHFPAWRGQSLGFVLADDDGHILSLLSTAHVSDDSMQVGNLRAPGPACLGCHGGGGFSEFLRAFDGPGITHSVFTSPGGRSSNRATISFPVFNDRWALAVFSPYESVQSSIERSLTVTLGLVLLMALVVGAAGWVGGERRRLRAAERETAAVRASEERFRAVFDSATDGILIVDPAGRILDVNRTLHERLGYSREEVLGQSVAFLDSAESAAVVPERMASLAQRGTAVFESEHRTRDGAPMPVEISARVLDLAGRRVVLSVIRDITERVAAERALRRYAREVEEANRLKDLFNDIVRHDLLTPLAVARGYAELLPDDGDGPGAEVVASLRRSLARLAELIRSAAHLSRLMETEQLETKEQDLGDILGEAVRPFEGELAAGGWSVEGPGPGPRPIRANPLLVEVFSNLVANALKFAEKVHRLRLTVREEGASWVVEVLDWGPGITAGERDRAFSRFERLGSRGTKGMGLGLAIAKRIVELHGGEIRIEDNPEGGCLFLVRLPKEGPAPGAGMASTEPSGGGGEGPARGTRGGAGRRAGEEGR